MSGSSSIKIELPPWAVGKLNETIYVKSYSIVCLIVSVTSGSMLILPTGQPVEFLFFVYGRL